MLVGTRRALLGRKLRPAFSASFLSETPVSLRAITYSGGANGTRVNAAGLIVPAVCPRIDFDPVTLAVRGLLVEEQRTNEIPRSTPSAASGTGWADANVTSALSAVSPDGTTNGAVLTTVGVGLDAKRTAQTANTARTGAFVASVYMRAGTDNGFMSWDDGGTGVTWYIKATLSGNGAVSSNGAVTASITPVGNGWYRVVGAFTGAGESRRISVGVWDGSADIFNYPGCTGAGKTLQAWGVQLEPGAFPSSLIPTAGATVTRTADDATVLGAEFSAWFNRAEGTFFGEYSHQASAVLTASRVLQADNNSNAERILLSNSGTGSVQEITALSVGRYFANTLLRNAGDNVVNRMGIAYSPAGGQGVLNGALASAGAAIAVMPNPDRLKIGRGLVGSGAEYARGHIRRVLYWPARLPNAALQALTA